MYAIGCMSKAFCWESDVERVSTISSATSDLIVMANL